MIILQTYVNFGENKIVFKIVNKNLINSRIKTKINVLAKSKTVCRKCFQKSPLLSLQWLSFKLNLGPNLQVVRAFLLLTPTWPSYVPPFIPVGRLLTGHRKNIAAGAEFCMQHSTKVHSSLMGNSRSRHTASERYIAYTCLTTTKEIRTPTFTHAAAQHTAAATKSYVLCVFFCILI